MQEEVSKGFISQLPMSEPTGRERIRFHIINEHGGVFSSQSLLFFVVVVLSTTMNDFILLLEDSPLHLMQQNQDSCGTLKSSNFSF